MTLTADHLAWQQRVFKETNAGSKFLDLERHTIRSTSNFCKYFNFKFWIFLLL